MTRASLLLALAAAEIAFYYRLSNAAAIMRHGASPEVQAVIAFTLWYLRDMAVVCVGFTIVSSWTTFWMLIKSAMSDSAPDPYRSRAFLAHIVMAMTLIGWASIDPKYFSSPAAAVAWNLGRIPIFFAAVSSFLVAAIPWRHWLRWYRASKPEIAVGAGVGIGAGVLAIWLRSLWWSSDDATLYGVYFVLRFFGAHPTISVPKRHLGVPGFEVAVGPPCAGFEGVALIVLVLGLYLWLWRKALRFPHALLLLPIGAAASWVSNLFRIAILIMIGVHYPDAAVKFFHSIAGWTSFILIGVGLVAASNELEIFRLNRGPDVTAVYNNGTAIGAYLLPLVVSVAAGMIIRPLSGAINLFYPMQVIATGCVLYAYRHHYAKFDWKFSWSSVAIGAIVFAFWIILARFSAPEISTTFESRLHTMPRIEVIPWIVMRLIGGVVAAPMSEELAFRGYLLRKLISADFESVEPRFGWLSFSVSSLLFGVTHASWFAGTLAGMAFAIALYRHGRISDAIIAHVTANVLIAAVVLSTGAWWLWA